MALTLAQRLFHDDRVLAVYERFRESPLAWPMVGRRLAAEVADALAAVDASPPGDVLDVACGQATFCVAIARGRPGRPVTGLDLSPSQLVRARRKAAVAGARVRFTLASATCMPFGDAVFSAVVSFTGLHQIPDHDAVVGEIARVLRPDGRFFGATFARPRGPGRLRDRLQKAVGLRPIDASEWEGLLAEAGLVDFRYVQRTPVWGVFTATRRT